uniref:Odontogenic, ameloblast associated n=1 Tax=Xenopus tropicalis TaxID=8364 RepID=A0A803JZB6_XENTR
MNLLVIFLHFIGASFALPLGVQRLLSASNSNEGGALNALGTGVLQKQLQSKIPGLTQIQHGARTPNLQNLIPLQKMVPNAGTPFLIMDGVLQAPYQNQQHPNQMMLYVVSYGLSPKQGQIGAVPPHETGTQQLPEQVLGCFVPQLNGDAANPEMIPFGGLQLPTKAPDVPQAFGENRALESLNLEVKVYPDNAEAPQLP